MTLPVRILQVTPRYPPSLGGIERHVEQLAKGLGARGLDVEVATSMAPEASDRVEVDGNVTVRRFSTIWRDEVFFLSPRSAIWMIRNGGRFDLIHAHSYHTPFALVGAIAARLHRVPLVVTAHYHGTGHTKTRRFLHRPYRRLGAWMIRQAALLICNSEAEETLIGHDFGASLPTVVVLPGIEIEIGAAKGERPATAGTTVLAGGRLEGYKQVELVVRAIELLPDDVRLTVFGEGPDLEQIVATARDSGVADRVDFVGRLTDEDLARRFRTADVFVSLSRKEAFGLTVLEAAATGTAVVCSDIPAYREMAGRLPDGALRLVSVDADPGAVAESIKAAAKAPRPTAPPATSLPSWDAMVGGVIDGYRTVLGARDRSGASRLP